MASPNVETRVYIHLIRHAQGKHNYNSRTTTPAVREALRAIHNPSLTERGEAEALDLRHRFPYMNELTHIICSPLLRTIQTAAIAFEPAIRAGIKPILIEDLRETGTGPTSTGTTLTKVLEELGELGKCFDVSNMYELWMVNSEVKYESEKRAKRFRMMLKQLTDVLNSHDPAIGLGPIKLHMWNGLTAAPLNNGRDIHVAVVTHAEILMKIIDEVKGDPNGRGYFWNAEFRTYEFRGAGNCEHGGHKPWDLLEIEESLESVHPSTQEEYLAERAKARELEASGVEHSAISKTSDAVLKENSVEKAKAGESKVSGVEIPAIANSVDVATEQNIVLPNGLSMAVLDPLLFERNPRI
ncbi:uncharacterized protein RCO7_02249 [Rhynchosporium graminicola]|uniref:Phosphoglycerate mutase family protein n=1 Tax=Rhynchosporium graminicola TaxID=2792576 RepID=A0A1E1LHD0_9HELO|nr:uncharacterized protein RCO7_02249 [Rhynchosporium commune]